MGLRYLCEIFRKFSEMVGRIKLLRWRKKCQLNTVIHTHAEARGLLLFSVFCVLLCRKQGITL